MDKSVLSFIITYWIYMVYAIFSPFLILCFFACLVPSLRNLNHIFGELIALGEFLEETEAKGEENADIRSDS